MSRNKKLLIAVLLLAFAAVKVVSLLWWQNSQPARTVLDQAQCNVHQGCVLPGGMQLKFSDQVYAKAPFDIELRGVDAAVQEVFVSFTMKDMDMGFNRYKLVRQPDGSWRAAQIRLPVCVQNRHDYLADIHIGKKVYQVGFAAR
ncbi:hypothetical protein LVJ83_04450 [Uruburuella testudinis]|uniref:Secreted protein n=1 Tax=Uruburuella testudinis TaxID=1282863 RepID=A0ABY4DUL9_9NEIS|nr:hypothetical protein [Uruburuella testudinis]UOO82720.1 hypothetical protein LVJ83_04450 [Uruburuella testudinis]